MCRYFPDLIAACSCPDCRACIDRELPLPPPGAFPAARAERLRELLEARHFVAVALEAPLARQPERAA